MKFVPVPGTIQKTLKYSPAQEHYLRRLASALVMQWDEIPNDLQDLLIDQAIIVDDRQDEPHARADFENFLRSVKITSLQKKLLRETRLDAQTAFTK